MIVQYLYKEDAWYFPHLSLNVYRKAIPAIDPTWLAAMLGVSDKQLESLVKFLEVVPSDIVHNYELTFSDDIIYDN